MDEDQVSKKSAAGREESLANLISAGQDFERSLSRVLQAHDLPPDIVRMAENLLDRSRDQCFAEAMCCGEIEW